MESHLNYIDWKSQSKKCYTFPINLSVTKVVQWKLHRSLLTESPLQLITLTNRISFII